jgi:hypothetical protein
MAILRHTDWAFYDDGPESGSIIKGFKNTPLILDTETTYLYRAGIEEISGDLWRGKIKLWYRHNNNGWFAVTDSSSIIRLVPTNNIIDNSHTVQRLTNFTYISTNNGFNESDGLAGGEPIQSSGFEALWSFEIIRNDVNKNDIIELKVGIGNSNLDEYGQGNPVIVVGKKPVFATIAGYISTTWIEDLPGGRYVHSPIVDFVNESITRPDIKIKNYHAYQDPNNSGIPIYNKVLVFVSADNVFDTEAISIATDSELLPTTKPSKFKVLNDSKTKKRFNDALKNKDLPQEIYTKSTLQGDILKNIRGYLDPQKGFIDQHIIDLLEQEGG